MVYTCPQCGNKLSADVSPRVICPTCCTPFDTSKEIPPVPGSERTTALTSEEKQRIYEEEKTRVEAQGQIKNEQIKKGTRKGCLGCLGVIVIIILFLIPSMVRDKKSAPRREKETAQKEKALEVFNQNVSAEVTKGASAIILKLAYHVQPGVVSYTIDFQPEVSETAIRENVKGLCSALRQIYEPIYPVLSVFVYGKQNSITICEAEYSPFTNRIVLK